MCRCVCMCVDTHTYTLCTRKCKSPSRAMRKHTTARSQTIARHHVSPPLHTCENWPRRIPWHTYANIRKEMTAEKITHEPRCTYNTWTRVWMPKRKFQIVNSRRMFSASRIFFFFFTFNYCSILWKWYEIAILRRKSWTPRAKINRTVEIGHAYFNFTETIRVYWNDIIRIIALFEKENR